MIATRSSCDSFDDGAWEMEETGSGVEFTSLAHQFREFQSQMKDPVIVGAMLNQLTEERRSTNSLLKQINQKLEKIFELEARLKGLEAKLAVTKTEAPAPVAVASEMPLQMLSSTDEKIMEFLRTKEKACAQDLQEKLHYKGKNAASSRLNALWKQGLLDKKYAGKVVYFVAKQTN